MSMPRIKTTLDKKKKKNLKIISKCPSCSTLYSHLNKNIDKDIVYLKNIERRRRATTTTETETGIETGTTGNRRRKKRRRRRRRFLVAD